MVGIKYKEKENFKWSSNEPIRSESHRSHTEWRSVIGQMKLLGYRICSLLVMGLGGCNRTTITITVVLYSEAGLNGLKINSINY